MRPLHAHGALRPAVHRPCPTPIGLRTPLTPRLRRCVQVTQPHSSQNGAYSTDSAVLEREKRKPVPSQAAAEAEKGVADDDLGITASPNSSNGTGGATPSSAAAARKAVASSNSSNGTGRSSSQFMRVPEDWQAFDKEMERIDGDVDPCESGEVLSCANLRLTAREKAAMEASTSDMEGDAEEGPGSYKQTKFSSWRRTIQIYAFALNFAFRYWRLGKKRTYRKMEGGMSKENVSTKRTELARWLKQGLINLGPTFIKIGQQFSTRVDVLSPEFIKELEELQDNVPPFSKAAVRETVERQFGKPVEEVFEAFSFRPLAAASLGQVHFATLNGKRVVVKVQRPGLRQLFDVDLRNVRVIAQWLQKVDPKSDGASRDWVAIYDECSRILYEEIDYVQEAEYARDFAENFKGVPWVKVPEIYREYLTQEVIVMEYVPGVKINNGKAIDEMGLDRDRLARLSVESYLQQLLRHGLFHADPHPGNVAVDDVGGGRLIYYDFGMMGRIQPQVRDGLRELFYGVYQKDSNKCLDALETMGVLVGGDRTAVKRTADFFLESFQERLAEQRREREENPESQKQFKGPRSKEDTAKKRKAILASIGEDLLVASADKPFRFPAEFTFVVRSFTVLDGIGKSLSPRFDISEISAPYARELILDGKSAVSQLQDRLGKRFERQNRAVKGLFEGPLTIQDINASLRRIENGDTKPRVRALELERSVTRMAVQQSLTLALVASSMFLNLGTVLTVSALPRIATANFAAAAVCGMLTLIKWFKLKKLDRQEQKILGAAAEAAAA